jgi:hypothetical protein
LADKRGQPSQGDNQDLVIGWSKLATETKDRRAERVRAQTIDGKVAQRRTGSSLDLDIRALKQE